VVSSFQQRAEIVAVCLGSVLFLAWSRQSSCQREYVIFRHTVWHCISVVALTGLCRASWALKPKFLTYLVG